MLARERVLAALEHRETDRVPIYDSPWETAMTRWRREGMPEGVTAGDHFGYEMIGFGADTSLRLPTEIVEETDEYIIEKNSNGATLMNWKTETSTPGLMGFTLTSRAVWEELKPRLAYTPERMLWKTDKPVHDAARAAGTFCFMSFAIGYDQLSCIAGPETVLTAMAMDPAWVADMFKTFMDTTLACAEEMIAAGYQFDGAWVYDDMGYRNGLFFSPQMYRTLLRPQHERIVDFFHGHGWKVVLHSCGNVTKLIPDLIEVGFDCLQPLEVKAGMDLLALKRDFGDRLAFMGGIDVRAMADPDPAVIEREIRSKIPGAMKGGGYIYHSDHSVPSNVSYAQYCRTLELVREVGRR